MNIYGIYFENKLIGKSKLEAGDPPMGCVSGIIIDTIDINEFAFFILHCGGFENEGEYRLELNNLFYVLSPKGEKIPFSGACILVYPDLPEAVIDIVGIPYPEYQLLFPKYVNEYYENNFNA